MTRFRQWLNNKLDILGMVGSMLCVLHCSAIPVMLAMGMMQGYEWMDSHWVEYLFLASAIIIASWSIVRSYLAHRRPLALIIVLIGFLVFAIGIAQHSHTEIGLTTLGGVLIALSHLVNWRITHKATHSTVVA